MCGFGQKFTIFYKPISGQFFVDKLVFMTRILRKISYFLLITYLDVNKSCLYRCVVLN